MTDKQQQTGAPPAAESASRAGGPDVVPNPLPAPDPQPSKPDPAPEPAPAPPVPEPAARPVPTNKSPTAADTDAELISEQLLANVESLFEDFPRFENIEELKKAPEWQTLNGFFRDAGKNYAIASHTEGDRRAWVEEKIRSDRDAIGQLNAFRVFRIHQMRSCENVSLEQVRDECDKKLDFAMNEGIREARKYIGESEASQGNRRPALEVADKAQRTVPSSPAAQSSPEVHNGVGSDRIEAIRHKIAAHPDNWITNEEAAIYYGCSVKTIRDWKDTGKLRAGPKRGSISNRSILELDSRTAIEEAKNKHH